MLVIFKPEYNEQTDGQPVESVVNKIEGGRVDTGFFYVVYKSGKKINVFEINKNLQKESKVLST